MPRIAYVNGAYMPHEDASVHIEDRGFQFADGVYEVIACIHGRLADETGHLDRLERSLSELGMDLPVLRQTLKIIMRELLRRNRLQNANLYIQVTRGQAPRDFKFPRAEVPPTLVMTARPYRFDDNPANMKGIKAFTVPDIRWKRRDIKTVALLPQVLAKQNAATQGGGEAFMVDEQGFITEGASSNVWILTGDGRLLTRKANSEILRGVTRTALQAICTELQIKVEEKNFTVEDAYDAVEIFTSSAVALVMPVIELDGRMIGDGKPGKVSRRLYDEYRAYVDGLRGEQLQWKA